MIAVIVNKDNRRTVNANRCFINDFHTVMYGDVNDDGNLSIDDVTALINYLLSGDAALVNMENADVNNDGKVNIDDVTALIDLLLRNRE